MMNLQVGPILLYNSPPKGVNFTLQTTIVHNWRSEVTVEVLLQYFFQVPVLILIALSLYIASDVL